MSAAPRSRLGFHFAVRPIDAYDLGAVSPITTHREDKEGVDKGNQRSRDIPGSVPGSSGLGGRAGNGRDQWAGLMMKPDDYKGPVAAFKSAERDKITKKGYTIILNMGDQISDLDGGFARKTFLLPNPFYFIP